VGSAFGRRSANDGPESFFQGEWQMPAGAASTPTRIEAAVMPRIVEETGVVERRPYLGETDV